jgi:uncharacterized protein
MRYSLHITNNCNLRCTYCYEDNKIDKQRKQFVISMTEIDEKLDKILAAGNCDELELLGGEVFLYPDKLEYILTKYHQQIAYFLITTNGTLRSQAIDNLIAKYKPSISVSLDDPQTVARQRVGIDFERVLENAKDWRELTSVGIGATLTPATLNQIKETFDFYCLEQGFDCIHFGCVEEWMNDHYWSIYKKEVKRFIQATSLDDLKRRHVSPWWNYRATKKEFIYEDGLEKVEIFNPHKMVITPYLEAKYYGYCLYCERLGQAPEPLIPAGVEVLAS